MKLRKMTRLIVLTSVFVCLLLTTSQVEALAQMKSGGLKISVAVDSAAFDPRTSAKATVKIENRTRGDLVLKQNRHVFFNLDVYGKGLGICTRGDCFVAYFRVKEDRTIKAGASFELEVELADLYWRDAISAEIDTSQPKNMAEVIKPGDYYLHVVLRLEPSKPRRGAPAFVESRTPRKIVKIEKP